MVLPLCLIAVGLCLGGLALLGPRSVTGAAVAFAFVLLAGMAYRLTVRHAARAADGGGTLEKGDDRADGESEERYRQIFNAESDSILVVDCELFKFVDANEAAVRSYGWSREELLTLTPADISAEPGATVALLVSSPERTHVPLRWHRRKDGTIFPVEIIGNFYVSRGRRMHVAAVRDVSERLAVEKMMRLRGAALDAAANAIMITGTDGTIEWANAAFTSLSGWSLAEAVGRNPRDLLKSGRHEPAFYRQMWEVITAGRVWKGELINQRKDGTPYTEEMTITPLRNDRGQITHFIAIKQDITERRAVQTALQQEKTLFNNLASSTPDRIYFKDRQSRFIRINEAMARFLGFTDLADAVGKSDFDIFSSEHASKAFGDEQRIMSSGEPLIGIEEKETWPDGSVTWASSTKIPLRNDGGEITGLVGISRDITESKRSQEALRESEERFSKAFRLAPVAVIMTALENGTILEANEAFLRMSGYRWDEIGGRTVIEIGWIEPETRKRMLERLEAEGRVVGMELALSAKGGRRVDSTFNGEIVEIGGKRRLLAILLDVTESHRMEEQLRQAQKMEAVGQLAGGVAHDFNNILAAILLQLGTLREDAGLGFESRATLRELEDEATRAAALTRQLLVFSRRQAMKVAPVDLNALVDNLLRMLRRLLGEDVVVEWQGKEGLPMIDADPGMMEQVLMNLCVNARDAMPEGGRIILQAAEITLDASVAKTNPEARAGRFVRLSVSDTGRGMDELTRLRMFEPFFTTKGPGKGTGLGLATVYGIVKQHSGWIEVETAPGRGSTFCVFLPARAADASRRVKGGPADMPRGHGETVLVVEDEAPLRQALSTALRRFDYKVIEAYSGPDALRQWQQHRDSIDLVVSDMVMPEGMNGADLLKKLRVEKPSLRAILVSGYVPNQSGSALPGIPLLSKPFEIPILLAAVRKSLDRGPAAGTNP
ncbi:MAG: PAS domain S-box protein [Opitutaceae bacterium]